MNRTTGQLTPVLLCGGSGTRLWPLSRTHMPKQFLRLSGEYSLLQETLRRLDGLAAGRVVVVAGDDHRFLLAEQLRELDADADILLEPCARNTAPAIAAAAHWALRSDPEAVLLVLPSDHLIADAAAFHRAVEAGLPHAQTGQLVTFGIVPTRAETGYGYIRRGAPVAGGYAVAGFVEKPDAPTAETYLASGEYTWNSGMFLFRADAFLRELERQAPTIAGAAADALAASQRDLDFVRLDKTAFAASTADSIDYAVMERAEGVVVIPLDAGWNDIGAWDALLTIGVPDAAGNRTVGDVLSHDSKGCYARASSRLVALVGMNDTVVVETADAVLVADKGRAQEVKHIVAALKAAGRAETEFHTVVHRPWGSYEGIALGPRYQVKRIIVKPGRALSLQKHHHRAEHWVVVTGTARVTRGDDVLLLGENESTYIPLGTVHRLENPGRIDLEIVEIQSGSYLGEDDIVRLEDVYGRDKGK
ncbi:MAG TPA: mannose-1-phosphate guanylyltransferase/mannose-6-phosphate isomerase [Rhodocyclaceae bacterium]